MIDTKKIESYVFDKQTHEALFKLSSNNIIDSIESPIASGKEAITFLGHLGDAPLVAKIYKVETSKFKNMEKYIKGDYRFKNLKKDKIILCKSKKLNLLFYPLFFYSHQLFFYKDVKTIL